MIDRDLTCRETDVPEKCHAHNHKQLLNAHQMMTLPVLTINGQTFRERTGARLAEADA